MKTTGKRVRYLREYLNKTQEQMANLCHTTVTSLSRIENESREPSQTTLNKIAENTGVEKDWLFLGKGEFKVNSPALKTASTDNPYKDELYRELKEQSLTWQQKYNDLFAMFNKVLDRGGNLGKSKALKYTAFVNLSNVLRAVA